MIFQAQPQATKAFPARPHGGKLVSPHQSCCTVGVFQSPEGVASKDSGSPNWHGFMYICILSPDTWVHNLFIRDLPPAETFLRYFCWGFHNGKGREVEKRRSFSPHRHCIQFTAFIPLALPPPLPSHSKLDLNEIGYPNQLKSD